MGLEMATQGAPRREALTPVMVGQSDGGLPLRRPAAISFPLSGAAIAYGDQCRNMGKPITPVILGRYSGES